VIVVLIKVESSHGCLVPPPPADETVAADGHEILEARWLTRAELSQRAAAGRPLGRVDSIDAYLLRSLA
jgi:hypothetical protein